LKRRGRYWWGYRMEKVLLLNTEEDYLNFKEKSKLNKINIKKKNIKLFFKNDEI
jgi:hypothetical protein